MEAFWAIMERQLDFVSFPKPIDQWSALIATRTAADKEPKQILRIAIIVISLNVKSCNCIAGSSSERCGYQLLEVYKEYLSLF